MASTTAKISVIQRYATKDGPGIRSTVFFMGCNLMCQWCANPELLDSSKKIMSFGHKCRRCGACIEACKKQAIKMGQKAAMIDRSRCNRCGKCVEVCPFEAYERLGIEITVEDLCARLLRDKDFYDRSGGGVTFSGGEAALQGEFLIRTAQLLRREEVRTALDTAGNLAWDALQPIVEAVDLVLYDLKAFDTRIHKEGAGVDNALILDNAHRIAQMGKDIIIRMIIIEGFNDAPQEITDRLKFVQSLGNAVKRVDLLNYHNLGEGKYKSMGMPYTFSEGKPCALEKMKGILRQAQSLGLPAFLETQ